MTLKLILGALMTLALQAPPAAERLTEVEHLRLQLLLATQAKLDAQYSAALAQAISEFRERPETRKLLADADATRLAVNDTVDKVFDAHKVSKALFKLNASTGEFILGTPAATEVKP